jgi:hypothetical protein
LQFRLLAGSDCNLGTKGVASDAIAPHNLIIKGLRRVASVEPRLRVVGDAHYPQIRLREQFTLAIEHPRPASPALVYHRRQKVSVRDHHEAIAQRRIDDVSPVIAPVVLIGCERGHASRDLCSDHLAPVGLVSEHVGALLSVQFGGDSPRERRLARAIRALKGNEESSHGPTLRQIAPSFATHSCDDGSVTLTH